MIPNRNYNLNRVLDTVTPVFEHELQELLIKHGVHMETETFGINDEYSELSDNQREFVKDVEDHGFVADFTYSGRGMEGKVCPAVHLDKGDEMITEAQYFTDDMGLGMVLYARH